MRLSVENGDYGWDVWLDGVLQQHVVMADDEKGEVERYSVDNFFGQTEKVCGKVEIRRSDAAGLTACVGCGQPADDPHMAGCKVEGLVAPVWSDSGEVKEAPNFCAGPLWDTYEVTYDDILSLALHFKGIPEAKPADPNAKPALPALTRVGGNKRGPGWCDE